MESNIADAAENDEFLSWFKARGGSVHSGVGITYFPSMGRGAIALQDIKRDTVLFTLPRSLTLSTRTSSLPPKIGEREWKKYQLHKGWVGLILCMLWEDQAGEYWKEYISSLPDRFQTPMFWKVEDIEELRGTSIFDKIGRVEAEKDYHEKLLPAIKSRPDIFPTASIEVHYSLQRYHIMGSRILSRSFHVEKWGGEGKESEDDQTLAIIANKSDEMDVDTADQDLIEEDRVDEAEDGGETDDEEIEDPSDVAMVPLADILNARYRSENAKLCYDSEDLQMICTQDIQFGDQIWNTYGDPPNSDLLRRYGHVDLISLGSGVPGNPADIVDIRADTVLNVLRSQGKDEFLLERVEWWLEEGGDDMFTLETNLALPDDFTSLIRLLSMPKVEWERTRDKGKVPKPKADIDVLRIVVAVLRKRLEDYKTSLEEDEALLESAEENTNKYMATIVRVGEKRILEGTIGEVMKRLAHEAGRDNKKRSMDSDEASKSNKRVKRL